MMTCPKCKAVKELCGCGGPCPVCDEHAGENKRCVHAAELAAERARTDALVAALCAENPVECDLPVLGPLSTAAVACIRRARANLSTIRQDKEEL